MFTSSNTSYLAWAWIVNLNWIDLNPYENSLKV